MPKEFYRIVVIDDIRVPLAPDRSSGITVEVARTPNEGLAVVQAYHRMNYRIGELWLDHDMGWVEGDTVTIWPVVRWLEEIAHAGAPLDVEWIFIHTSNPWGRDQMKAALEKYYRVSVGELLVDKGWAS